MMGAEFNANTTSEGTKFGANAAPGDDNPEDATPA
jgi:hypothetical protein